MLDTNTCNDQMVCDYCQKQPENWTKPILYWTRTQINAQKRYDTTQRDFFEIVWLVLLFRAYLKRQRFTICTDNDALEWNLNFASFWDRLTQWRWRVSKLGFNVAYRDVVKH